MAVLLRNEIFTRQYRLLTLSTRRSYKLLKIWLENLWKPDSHKVTPRNAVWLHKVVLFVHVCVCVCVCVNGTAEQKTDITKLRNGTCQKTEFQGKSVSEIGR
jgi:hypothetical protein